MLSFYVLLYKCGVNRRPQEQQQQQSEKADDGTA